MDNRRLLLAALLSAGFLILWNIIFPPARPEPTDPAMPNPAVSEAADIAADTAADTDATRSSATQAGTQPVAPQPSDPMAEEFSSETDLVPEPVVVEVAASAPDEIELVTSRGVATISNRGGQLVSFVTADRPGSATDGVEMVRDRADGEPYPFGFTNFAGEPLALNEVLFQVTTKSDRQAVLEYRGAAGEARKVFRINDADQLEVEATTSVPGWGIYLGPGIRNAALDTLEDKYLRHGGIVSLAGDIDRIDAQKVHEVRAEPAASANWIALEDTYFLTGVVPRLPLVQAHYLPGRVSLEGERYTFETMPANPTKEQKDGPRDFGVVLEPGPSGFSGVAYLGPEDLRDAERLWRWSREDHELAALLSPDGSRPSDCSQLDSRHGDTELGLEHRVDDGADQAGSLSADPQELRLDAEDAAAQPEDGGDPETLSPQAQGQAGQAELRDASAR